MSKHHLTREERVRAMDAEFMSTTRSDYGTAWNDHVAVAVFADGKNRVQQWEELEPQLNEQVARVTTVMRAGWSDTSTKFWELSAASQAKLKSAHDGVTAKLMAASKHLREFKEWRNGQYDGHKFFCTCRHFCAYNFLWSWYHSACQVMKAIDALSDACDALLPADRATKTTAELVALDKKIREVEEELEGEQDDEEIERLEEQLAYLLGERDSMCQ